MASGSQHTWTTEDWETKLSSILVVVTTFKFAIAMPLISALITISMAFSGISKANPTAAGFQLFFLTFVILTCISICLIRCVWRFFAIYLVDGILVSINAAMLLTAMIIQWVLVSNLRGKPQETAQSAAIQITIAFILQLIDVVVTWKGYQLATEVSKRRTDIDYNTNSNPTPLRLRQVVPP